MLTAAAAATADFCLLLLLLPVVLCDMLLALVNVAGNFYKTTNGNPDQEVCPANTYR